MTVRAKMAFLAVAMIGGGMVLEIAQAEERPQAAALAAEFAKLFLEENYEALGDRMAPEMRAAMPPATCAQVRGALVAQNGALKRAGEAWLEDTVQDYRRFRVPVEFEQRTIDLRIVLDGEDKVAGFFHVPHTPRLDPQDAAGAAPRPEVAGRWQGSITLPSTPLAVTLELRQEGGTWSGTCDIPAQGAKGLLLDAVRVDGSKVAFSLYGIPGDPTFQGTFTGDGIAGTFTQAGQNFPFSLGRGTVARPVRPQEPMAPLPYREEEVTFAAGELRLAGTLSIPAGDGPFPAALLLSGSGAQNRDEEIFAHRPFRVLADQLTRRSIAVLRVDDRGVGGSSGNLQAATSDDLVGDALAGIGLLRGRPEIDARRVGLIGHSEGAVIAPLVASRSSQVAFIVMLAGTGVPGADVLVRQMELITRAAGVGEDHVQRIRKEQRRLVDLVRSGSPEEAVRRQARELIRAQITAGSAVLSEQQLEAAAARTTAQLLSPWFRYFLSYDPRPALAKVRVPVLALCGERDLQVAAAQNLPEIRKALERAGNADVTIRELPGLNHLLQKAKTGSPDEYYSIEETADPAALELIGSWILERFGNAPEPPPEGGDSLREPS